MGKTFRNKNKWYDDDLNENQRKKNKFNQRRQKKLRKIVSKQERLSDNADGVASDKDVYGTHI